jgi:hypothetical protein
MESIYLWPDQPALSLLVIYAVSVVALWAAREPMLRLLRGLGESLAEGFEAIAQRSRTSADELRERTRAALLASGSLEVQGKLEGEFQRIDASFSERLGHYSELHRRLDDLLLKLDADYQKCGDAPPEVPGWAATVKSISGIPTSGDPNVRKVLEGIKKSIQDAERKALQAHREDTSKRHKLLNGMRPVWKEVRGLATRMKDAVEKVLETARKVDGYIDDYQRIRDDERAAARALTQSAWKLMVISLIVLAVALGGAFINFQLIALPMSELVPAGARIGGVPVATVSALVIVLMEVALGLFLMDMLGITELFPKLSAIPASRRRLILAVALIGLFFLASVESSLAILREKIVEADALLKMSLAGAESAAITEASTSRIPVVGQAVLGFVLPWILALVAVPLEMLLDSGRHVLASLTALVLAGLGNAAGVLAHAMKSLTGALPNFYDVYISIPLRIERAVQDHRDDDRIVRRSEKPDTHPGVASEEVA